MADIARTKRTHVFPENGAVAPIALFAETLKHRFTVVQMILLDPLLDLDCMRVEQGTAFGTRHGFRFASQVPTNRVARDSQLPRNGVDGLSLRR